MVLMRCTCGNRVEVRGGGVAPCPRCGHQVGAPMHALYRQSEVASGKAIISFTLGVLSFFFPLVPAIPGVIIGILALRDIRRQPSAYTGRGLAIAGIVLSIFGNLLLLFWIASGALAGHDVLDWFRRGVPPWQ